MQRFNLYRRNGDVVATDVEYDVAYCWLIGRPERARATGAAGIGNGVTDIEVEAALAGGYCRLGYGEHAPTTIEISPAG